MTNQVTSLGKQDRFLLQSPLPTFDVSRMPTQKMGLLEQHLPREKALLIEDIVGDFDEGLERVIWRDAAGTLSTKNWLARGMLAG